MTSYVAQGTQEGGSTHNACGMGSSQPVSCGDELLQAFALKRSRRVYPRKPRDKGRARRPSRDRRREGLTTPSKSRCLFCDIVLGVGRVVCRSLEIRTPQGRRVRLYTRTQP